MKNEKRPHAIEPKKCLAKTRKGTPCQSFAVNGKNRCRMHGGAEGSGGQEGNQNALKHGRYTYKARAFLKFARTFLKQFKGDIKEAATLNRQRP